MSSAVEVEGRSLLYLRSLLGCRAHWASAKDAWEDLREYAYIGRPEEIGVVIFFEMEPWGDVGLYVGGDKALRLVGGNPVLVEFSQDLSFLGWVDGEVFRDASSGPLPH